MLFTYHCTGLILTVFCYKPFWLDQQQQWEQPLIVWWSHGGSNGTVTVVTRHEWKIFICGAWQPLRLVIPVWTWVYLIVMYWTYYQNTYYNIILLRSNDKWKHDSSDTTDMCCSQYCLSQGASWFWQSWQTKFRVFSLLCSFSGIVVQSRWSHLLQHSHLTHTELPAYSVYIQRYIGHIVTVVLLSEEDVTYCLCLLTVGLFLLAVFYCFCFSLIFFHVSCSASLYFSFFFSSLLPLRASAAACFSSCHFCFSSFFLFLTFLCTHLSFFLLLLHLYHFPLFQDLRKGALADALSLELSWLVSLSASLVQELQALVQLFLWLVWVHDWLQLLMKQWKVAVKQ